MPRGDKPTTVALALKDGWVYEDTLPASITKDQYDWWFKESLVLDGVRMGPPLTTKPQSTAETLEPCWCSTGMRALRIESNIDHGDFGCRERGRYVYCSNCWTHGPTFIDDKKAVEGWNRLRRISSASAAPVVDNNELISRRDAIEIANARLEDVPDSVDLEADRSLFAAGYLAAAGSIKAGLQRTAAVGQKVNMEPRVCLKCGHEERYSDNEAGYCYKKLDIEIQGHSAVMDCGCYCQFPALPTIPSSTSARAATTEQPDPSTCPGCAAGRCMVHEPIIRADATSTVREATGT